MVKEVPIKDIIKLDQFLKLVGIASTGGQSKIFIQTNKVKVNGETENRRGRKIKPGDLIEIDDFGKYKVIS